MGAYAFTRTPTLDIGYLEWNPRGRRVAVLLHGWPDSPETWRRVAEAMAQAGLRVLAPALRGYGPTRFRNADTPRSGQLSALGRDLIEFLDAMGVAQPLLVGHDWGARAVANACGLQPGVAAHLVMISVGYGTNNPSQPLSLAQAKTYWYHWFMATPRGEAAVRNDRLAFTRLMWDTWGPGGWFTEGEFEEAARAFENPDWADIVLHCYRHRWGFAAGDPAYAADDAKLDPAPTLSVPTLLLHGAADYVNLPESSAGKERFFSGPYRRVLLDGVGHFPQRENAAAVAAEILRFCA